jgi:hypothetical protein
MVEEANGRDEPMVVAQYRMWHRNNITKVQGQITHAVIPININVYVQLRTRLWSVNRPHELPYSTLYELQVDSDMYVSRLGRLIVYLGLFG